MKQRHPPGNLVADELASSPPGAMASFSVALIRGFELRKNERPLPLPMSVQRLVAFLALQRRPVMRLSVAAALWLDVPEQRSMANLRSALWRLRRTGCPIVDVMGCQIALGSGVVVDIEERPGFGGQSSSSPSDFDMAQFSRLTGELLPGWYDDWVIIERERFHQLRLHTLEAWCERLTSAGCYGRAIEAGLAAVAGEPLRESAQRVLIGAYISEGNVAAAVRQYRGYVRLLNDELGLQPSSVLSRLISAAAPSI